MTATYREKYFSQNDRECANCGSCSSLHVHHKDGDATNDEIENLIALCDSCHRKVHMGARESKLLSTLADEVGPGHADRFDPDDFDDVPPNAGVTVKETQPGLKYYYWQWRDGGQIRSQYIAPTDDGVLATSADARRQSSLADW